MSEADAIPAPHNIEAEQGLLGALLADSSGTWPLIRGQSKPDHFYDPLHARLYEAIDTLAGAGKVASPVTVKNYFDQDQTLAEVDGIKYLVSLVANAPVRTSVKAYAELLRDLAARRQAVMAARELIDNASTIAAQEPFQPAIASHIHAMQQLFDEGSER
jgi:replicative DNA helicase